MRAGSLAARKQETTIGDWEYSVSSGLMAYIHTKCIDSYFRFLIKEPTNQAPFLTHANNVKTFYTWHKLGFYTTWTPLKSLTVLCFGLAPHLKHLLSNLEQVQLEDPFSFHAIVVEKIIGLYDSSLWSWRDLIRQLEEV